jgi:hypothetical protein
MNGLTQSQDTIRDAINATNTQAQQILDDAISLTVATSKALPPDVGNEELLPLRSILDSQPVNTVLKQIEDREEFKRSRGFQLIAWALACPLAMNDRPTRTDVKRKDGPLWAHEYVAWIADYMCRLRASEDATQEQENHPLSFLVSGAKNVINQIRSLAELNSLHSTLQQRQALIRAGLTDEVFWSVRLYDQVARFDDLGWLQDLNGRERQVWDIVVAAGRRLGGEEVADAISKKDGKVVTETALKAAFRTHTKLLHTMTSTRSGYGLPHWP